MNNKQAAQGAGVSKQVDELATISLEALFQRLDTTKAGLSEEEAEKRLDQFGPNEVAAEKEHTWISQVVYGGPQSIGDSAYGASHRFLCHGRSASRQRDAVDGYSWIGLAVCSRNSRKHRGGEIESNDQRHGDGDPQWRG